MENWTTILALSDNMQVGVIVTQMIFNIALAIVLLWLKNNVSKINGLENEVKETATQIVDQKLNLVETKMTASLDQLKHEVSQINNRLGRGDDFFDKLNERDHAMNLKVVQAIEGLKNHITENFATKNELKETNQKLSKVELNCATQHHGGNS